jgi:hypothetical protein
MTVTVPASEIETSCVLAAVAAAAATAPTGAGLRAVLEGHPMASKNLIKIHAQEALGSHQEGGESHQVLTREAVHMMGPFQEKNHRNKDIHAVSFYACVLYSRLRSEWQHNMRTRMSYAQWWAKLQLLSFSVT